MVTSSGYSSHFIGINLVHICISRCFGAVKVTVSLMTYWTAHICPQNLQIQAYKIFMEKYSVESTGKSMLGSPDFFLLALAVVKGGVEGVGHILAVIQLTNPVRHQSSSPQYYPNENNIKWPISRLDSLAVGVLPEWRLRDPHLFAHFLICAKLVAAKFNKQLGQAAPFPLSHILASPSAQWLWSGCSRRSAGWKLHPPPFINTTC